MKQKWIDAFMDTANRFAELSSAKRLKVGAVVVKDNRIISIGYNGMPSGWTNECENKIYIPVEDLTGEDIYIEEDGRSYKLETKDSVIHAEANAISKLAKSNESGLDSIIFCTHAPCIHCAKMIYGAGIRVVYYRDDYRNFDGIRFLTECDVICKQV